MSVVTDLVLLTDAEPDSPPILRLNAWCEEHADGQGFKHLPVGRDAAGGHKVFMTEVYLCSGNYFPWPKLLKAFPTFPWGPYSKEISALILQDETVERWIGVHADGRLIAPSEAANELGSRLTVARAPARLVGAKVLCFNGAYWNVYCAGWTVRRDATLVGPAAAEYMIGLLGPTHPGITAVDAKDE